MMLRSGWLATALVLSACGAGAAPTDYKPPLVTLHGTGPGLGTNGNNNPDLRIAIVWTSGVNADGFPHRVAQDVSWIRTGATSFDIAMTHRPPDEVLQNGPVTGRIIAYHDLNHNQQLDFASITDTAFTDQVVAFDPDLVVTYNEIDGDGSITLAEAGNPVSTITLYGSTAPSLTCSLLDWIPRSEFEAGRHSFEHDLNVGPWREEIIYYLTATCPDNVPPPTTTNLSCDVPATVPHLFDASYTTQPSDFIANTCGPLMRVCQGSYAQNASPPPGWPCPCDPTKYTCGDGNLDL